ncbi:hypothetical protein ACR79S_20020 [Sphingobacterium spiritivorum]|uniref:hypothetical protein n=1 Tax=Sphingobacterium spiritivorum TaxID=258 RepID=UPI003DA32D0D
MMDIIVLEKMVLKDLKATCSTLYARPPASLVKAYNLFIVVLNILPAFLKHLWIAFAILGAISILTYLTLFLSLSGIRSNTAILSWLGAMSAFNIKKLKPIIYVSVLQWDIF